MIMPNIRKRRNPNGQMVYYLDYKDRDGKRQRPTISPRKADAERAALAIYHQMMDGQLGSLKKTEPTRVSLQTLIDSFMLSKQHRVKPLSLNRYDIHARNLLAFFQDNFQQ